MAEVEQAVSGVDLNAIMLVAQASQAAIQQAKDSAKLAHQANAGMSGLVGTIAMNRFAKCNSAINQCEDICTECPEETIAKESTPGELTAKEAAAQAARKQCDAIMRRCSAYSTQCNTAALQAAIAGIQAATSLLAAKKLDACKEGDKNCKSDPDSDSDSASEIKQASFTPPHMGSPLNPGLMGSSEFKPGRTNNKIGPAQFLPGQKKGSNPDPKSDDDKATKTAKVNTPPNSNPDTPLSPLSSSPLDSPSPFADSYGAGGVPSSENLFAGNSLTGTEDEDGLDEESEEGRERYSDGSSSFVGGEGSSGKQKGRPYASSRSKRPKKIKTALQTAKKGNLKRDVFSKADSHSSIFEKMSKIITSYCAKEAKKCY